MRRPFRPPAISSRVALVAMAAALLGIADIGGLLYAPYRAGRAAELLTHPTENPDRADSVRQMKRALGYQGFLSQATAYLAAKDPAAIGALHQDVQQADNAVRGWPVEAGSDGKQTAAAIVALYDSALAKLTDGSASEADLLPLYAAQPVLDSIGLRAQAGLPRQANADLRLWTTVLGICGWAGLTLALLCAGALVFYLRQRQSLPLQSVIQSIQNMVRGDMRTAIWGVERQDHVGDLARAVDMARYHFSQLPDLSLISEQGPVRLRFEGATRSLFDAMMSAIAVDADSIRTHAQHMAGSVHDQHSRIEDMAKRVEQTVDDLARQGRDGDHLLRSAVQAMTQSAGALTHAHAHAANQLNRLIPALQERATGLAEIATITGRQAAQSLQTLSHSDAGLRASADQAEALLARLSSTADDLGERLFGAINLLQASGRILAETTQVIRSGGGSVVHAAHDEQFAGMPSVALQAGALQAGLDHVVSELQQTRADIATRLEALPDRVRAIAAMPVQAVSGQTTTEIADIVADAVDRKLDPRWAEMATTLRAALPAPLDAFETDIALLRDSFTIANGQVQSDLVMLSNRIETATRAMAAAPQEQAQRWQAVTTQIEDLRNGLERALTAQLEQQFGTMAGKLDDARSLAEETASAIQAELRIHAENAKQEPGMREMVRDHWYQIAGQIEATRSSIADNLADQALKLEIRLRAAAQANAPEDSGLIQRQIALQTDILADLVATLGTLDEHIQQIKTDMNYPRRA